MNKMKKSLTIISLLVALILLMSVLVGCGGLTGKKDTASDTDDNENITYQKVAIDEFLRILGDFFTPVQTESNRALSNVNQNFFYEETTLLIDGTTDTYLTTCDFYDGIYHFTTEGHGLFSDVYAWEKDGHYYYGETAQSGSKKVVEISKERYDSVTDNFQIYYTAFLSTNINDPEMRKAVVLAYAGDTESDMDSLFDIYSSKKELENGTKAVLKLHSKDVEYSEDNYYSDIYVTISYSCNKSNEITVYENKTEMLYALSEEAQETKLGKRTVRYQYSFENVKPFTVPQEFLAMEPELENN